jgi:hypothetical protein
VAFPLGNIMLHLSGKIDKESEAKKGIIKLMLLHICGNIDINSTSITNITVATPLKGMQVVLNQPCAAQARQFTDLVADDLELSQKQDYTNICSSQVLIWVTSNVLASHMLQGNFATEKLLALKLKCI